MASAEAQVVERADADAQTESETDRVAAPSSDDPSGLSAFLSRVLPSVEEALRENVSTTAFRGLEAEERDAERREGRPSATQICTLSLSRTEPAPLQVRSLPWNARGSLVAAAFGRWDFAGLCRDPGFVAVWNLQKAGADALAASAPRPPDYTVELSSYAQCAAFHPQKRLLITCGAFEDTVPICVELGREVRRRKGKSGRNAPSHPWSGSHRATMNRGSMT